MKTLIIERTNSTKLLLLLPLFFYSCFDNFDNEGVSDNYKDECSIVCQNELPDFKIVDSKLLCPSSLSTNYQIAWRVTLTNIGKAAASSNVQAWLSKDTIRDVSDFGAGGRITSILKSCDSLSFDFGAGNGGGTINANHKYLLLETDWQNNTKECNENNNIFVIPLPADYPNTLCGKCIDFPANSVAQNASFIGRGGHNLVVFDEKMWIVGGHKNTGARNDVWYSKDGLNWTEAMPVANFTKRWLHSTVVFDNKIWVIGGTDDEKNLSDIWYSSDGVNWMSVEKAPFLSRTNHKTVVFNNKIWIIGGSDSNGVPLNDVWYSSDGMNWYMVTDNAFTKGKTHHRLLFYDDKLWVIGSLNDSEIWNSTDGKNWNLINENAPFGNRYGQREVVFCNKMWLIGGGNNSVPTEKDIWYSTDGISWIKATSESGIEPISGHAATVYRNKIWVIGGWTSDPNDSSEVWCFE